MRDVLAAARVTDSRNVEEVIDELLLPVREE